MSPAPPEGCRDGVFSRAAASEGKGSALSSLPTEAHSLPPSRGLWPPLPKGSQGAAPPDAGGTSQTGPIGRGRSSDSSEQTDFLEDPLWETKSLPHTTALPAPNSS